MNLPAPWKLTYSAAFLPTTCDLFIFSIRYGGRIDRRLAQWTGGRRQSTDFFQRARRLEFLELSEISSLDACTKETWAPLSKFDDLKVDMDGCPGSLDAAGCSMILSFSRQSWTPKTFP